MEKPRILVTNDDGIYSEGLRKQRYFSFARGL